MDGDSTTEHRSRAFCSPPHSHVFSCDEDSRRPIQPKSSKEREVDERVCLHSPSSPDPPRSVVVDAVLTGPLRCALFSVSFSFSDFTDTEPRSRGASLCCFPPREKRVEARSVKRSPPAEESVKSDQLRAAVAPLREMCVGMATQGHRHTHRHTQRGAGSSRRRQGRLREPSASGRNFQNKSMSLKTTG